MNELLNELLSGASAKRWVMSGASADGGLMCVVVMGLMGGARVEAVR